MTEHDALLERLRPQLPSLVDAAVSLGLPNVGIAPSLDDDDCTLVMMRAERIAFAIVAADGWTDHGDVDDKIRPYGTAGGTIRFERPGMVSKANQTPETRVELVHARPGRPGRIRIIAHLPDVTIRNRPDRTQALAVCLAAHRTAALSATAGRAVVRDTLLPNATHVATLLSHTLRPDLEPGRAGGPATPPRTVVVGASDGARRLSVVPTWGSSSNDHVRLDDATYARLEAVMPRMLSLTVDHGPSAIRSTVRDEPDTRMILSRARAVVDVPQQPADGVAVMRALGALGLDAMPTLVRRKKP